MKTSQLNQAIASVEGQILVAISLVVDELKRQGKASYLPALNNSLIENIFNKLHNPEFAMHNDFYKAAKEVIWASVNCAEAEYIIANLKSCNKEFAKEFFMGTKNTGCNLSRLRSKFNKIIAKSYGVQMSAEQFASFVVNQLNKDGKWGKLDKFSYNGNFFSWLETVLLHEITEEVEDLLLVKTQSEQTAGTTRGLTTSIEPEVWQLAIEDVNMRGLSHDILTALYVNRKAPESLPSFFKMSEKDFAKAQKTAHKTLRHRLIMQDSPYAPIILRDKEMNITTYSDQAAYDIGKWLEDKIEEDPFDGIIDAGLSPEERNQKVIDIIESLMDKLEWTPEKRKFWRMDFIDGCSTEEIAEEFGHTNGWVYTRRNRTKDDFNKAVREWWEGVSK